MGHDVSRRTFLKGGALFGAGAATTALFGSLTGCSEEQGNTGGVGAQATTVSEGAHPYAVHAADVIVVGGGMAGLMAARTAYEAGASVIMVDKGPVGHSGNSGLLWGQTYVTAELTDDDAKAATGLFVFDTMGIINQEQARNVTYAQMECRPRAALEQTGNVFQRGDDGDVIGINITDAIAVTHGAIYRQAAQQLIRTGVPVFDNMMMLDITQDEEGAASGVIAVSLKDSTAHLFRGKKIILCTGGYQWTTRTCASPEQTGEGHLAMLKRGCKFKDMEFPQYDFCSIRPYGYRPDEEKDCLEIGVSFAVNGEVEHRICNKDKAPIKGEVVDADGKQAAFQSAMTITAKEIYAGNGTPGDGSNNGLLFSLVGMDEESNNQSYPTYKGFMKYTTANLGFEFPEYTETISNQYSSCGIPDMDAATCESEIPGLYAIFGAISNFSSMWNSGQAYLAAKDAATKIEGVDTLGSFSADEVEATLSKAYGYLAADSADGIRANEVHRRIQRAFYKGQEFLKDGAAMEEMLEELKRIEKEDVPKMCCSDKSSLFNRDWRMAMEVESMLMCSYGTFYAAMERKESRSPFFRKDYPKMDNDNFLCHLWTTVDEDGNWKVEKGDLVDTIVPKAEIIEQLGELDISIPNNHE